MLMNDECHCQFCDSSIYPQMEIFVGEKNHQSQQPEEIFLLPFGCMSDSLPIWGSRRPLGGAWRFASHKHCSFMCALPDIIRIEPSNIRCDWRKHQAVMVSPDVQRKSYLIIGWLITAGGLLVMSYSAAWHGESDHTLP